MATAARRHARTGTGLATTGRGLIGIESLSAEAGMHPEIVRRFIGLGLVSPSGGTRAAPLFERQDARLLARAGRLRRDLGVDYTGAVLACELLARIARLEALVAAQPPIRQQHEVTTWIRTA
jgi:hypothetical protein